MIKDKKEISEARHSAHPSKEDQKVLITKNGPYIVSGGLPLQKEIIVSDDQGTSLSYEKGESYPKQETYALCRCGHSHSKPYCDGTHATKHFKGDEVASREKFEDIADRIDGPDLILRDLPDLCSRARFCHLAGGVWANTENSDDPEAKDFAIRAACNCPAGRLVPYDKETGKAIEPDFKKSISLLEDPYKGVSGPIYVKGGVEIESSDGTKLEKRNRVTLCRCGESKNKPYCDGSHIDCGFTDGDSSLKE